MYVEVPVNPDTGIGTCEIGPVKAGKYTVKGMGIEHDIREFGNLINMITQFYVNPKGKLVSFIAKFKKMPADIDVYDTDATLLDSNGIKLNPQWSASGINENVRVMRDFSARFYLIDRVDDELKDVEQFYDKSTKKLGFKTEHFYCFSLQKWHLFNLFAIYCFTESLNFFRGSNNETGVIW